VDGLKPSIERKIIVEKMGSLEKYCHLALRIDKLQMKRKHKTR